MGPGAPNIGQVAGTSAISARSARHRAGQPDLGPDRELSADLARIRECQPHIGDVRQVGAHIGHSGEVR